MSKLRVLFVTPAASRSGAPMLMLHLIRWLRSNANLEMSVILLSGGAMDEEFAAEIRTEIFYLPETIRSRPMRWLHRRPRMIRRQQEVRVSRCRRVVSNWPPDLVYCNSAASVGVLDALGPYNCPVLINVHELPFVLQAINWIPGGVVPLMKRHVTHYLAGSRIVASKLMSEQGVAENQVTVIHDFSSTIEFPYLSRDGSAPLNATRLTALGISGDALVIGMIATVEWRKGADLLIPLACATLSKTANLPVHFVWVGGGSDVEQLRFDVAAAGLGHRVHLVGPTTRTADWYPAFTLFALPSREDPFPLVCLEAAATGLPIVCFNGGGGMPEFVEEDCGISVAYLDLNEMATAIARLLKDADLRQRMGMLAADKVRARHDISVAGPQVLRLIQRLTGDAKDRERTYQPEAIKQ